MISSSLKRTLLLVVLFLRRKRERMIFLLKNPLEEKRVINREKGNLEDNLLLKSRKSIVSLHSQCILRPSSPTTHTSVQKRL